MIKFYILSVIAILVIGHSAIAQQISTRCITACLSFEISEADRLACRHHCPQNPQMQDPPGSTQIPITGNIEGCRKAAGSVTTITIGDRLCQMDLTGCRQDGQLILPGSRIQAICDSVESHENENCSPPCPPGKYCPTRYTPCRECPTDPNECANDDQTDGIGRYKSTAIAPWEEQDNIMDPDGRVLKQPYLKSGESLIRRKNTGGGDK